ncbi:hypothetical protein [Mucilaginibacter jinjuensis]|uniref:Uncharacterized protein n=1 Tax=Mucilaginibacter jinjuensis TaxID=1176721 RepID=A0ABY7T2K1_9SPHI|nr:hypothetical protein [Mucilaginibacter jinjuensis]WCT10483.1 hypothetical protein PQO05_17235 [Mucilaginibacter jinjuensis]
MSYLIIPIQVDALLLNQGSSCIGQDIDFKELPYYNNSKEIFINQDRPFLAESIIRQPFANDSLYLEKGVHLHWALPGLVTSGRQIEGKTVFPAAPNRWYILKEKNGIREEWIVESDYIWAPDDYTCPINKLCTGPLNTNLDLKGAEQPYAYLGRKYSLEEWLNASYEAKRYWRNTHKEHLTATGWGSLAFDTFYANSRSVFGMHDADTDNADPNQTFRYTVLGWYDKESDAAQHDFIRNLLSEWKKDVNINETAAENRLKLFTERVNASVLNADLTPINEAGLSDITNTMCYGFIEMHNCTDAFPAADNIQVSVATTPAEAISAIIIDSKHEDLSLAGQLVEEERLEAILNFDDINDLRLDLAHRLRETRHQNGFIPRDGLFNWSIILEDTRGKATPGNTEENPDDDDDVDSPILQLTSKLTSLEKSLRNAQYNYDLTKHELSSALDALYIDWSRYMMSMYPPEGQTRDYPDADEIRFHIANGSLKNAEKLKQDLGIYPDLNKRGNITENTSGVGNKVAMLISQIDNELEKLNKKLHEKYPRKNYKLIQEAGTQYWEALPPTLVLFTDGSNKQANELLKFSDRFLKDEEIAFLVVDDQKILSDQMLQHGSAFSLAHVMKFLKNIRPKQTTFFGESGSPVNAWHTFRVEWKVELFPLATGNEITKSTRKFDTGFITQNYTLPEDDVDLGVHQSLSGLSLLATGSVYTGSSFVTDTIRQGYINRLEGFKTNDNTDNVSGVKRAKKYLDTLKEITLLGLNLTGFNAAMLQQKNISRLAPADPFGFNTHQNFAGQVGNLLVGGEGRSPDPRFAFNPIRSGAVKIAAIRLIDIFGRSRDVVPTRLITPTPNKIAQKESWVNLPPRLSQPATMSMRWVESRTKIVDKDSNSQVIESPVCGWMLPVYMNQRIEFFDAAGKHLGAITHKGQWENSVFDHEIAQSKNLNFVSNIPLRKVIEWIRSRSSDAKFHETFIRIFRETTNNILPESANNHSLFEIIAGTPIAITQINLNLYLKGKASFDVSWNTYRSELAHKTGRHSKGFTEIEFPYVLGDFHQLNDGVVAYWKNDGEKIDGPVYFNNAMNARLTLPKPVLTTSEDEILLPSGLEDEIEYRYNKRKKFIDLLFELNENNSLCKHEFTRRYVKNGAKYWDILIDAQWIQLKDKDHKDIKRSLDNDNMTCTIDDPAQLFTMLMHPKGMVHLSTGILPVKKLQLPEESFKRALRSIELAFLAAPVITPANQLQLSLHQDSRFEWSWLKAEKKKKEACSASNPPVFKRTLQRPHIQMDHFIKSWNDYYSSIAEAGIMLATDAWKGMLEFKFIEKARVYGKEGFFFFKPDKLNEIKEQLESGGPTVTNENTLQMYQLAKLLEPLLPALIKGITPFDGKATKVVQQCITEGWLAIKSTR